jgi:long-chain acyl-CoA synthetase
LTSTSQVLRVRAEMEDSIAGQTIPSLLRDVARRSGGNPAYSDRDDSSAPWQTLTWAETRHRVLELAAGLVELGLAPVWRC